jgi:hypothetical protein
MKNILIIIALLFFTNLYVCGSALGASSEQERDFVVIVNAHGPLIDVDRGMIKAIYLGDKKFVGGATLKPANFHEGALKESFLKDILGMSSKEYKLYWVKKVFQESARLPRSIATIYSAVEFVKGDKGAIAYIPAKSSKILGRGVVVIRP